MITNFEWDGEKVKATTPEKVAKHTPKEILEALGNVRTQLSQMENQKAQFGQQMKQVENSMISARKHEAKLKEFEEKCVSILVDKLKLYVTQLTEECKTKAKKSADETIAKDPDAYLPAQIKQLPYLNFQKLLATDSKIADKIPADLISKYLYDTPCFDNPFKD